MKIRHHLLAMLLLPALVWAEDPPDAAAADTQAPATAADPVSADAAADDNATAKEGKELPREVPRVVPYPDASRHRAVLDYLRLNQRQQEAVTLVAGETSFYGLFLRERSGKPQGGALILHDLEQHGQWPQLIAPLREELPDVGWTTLALELPLAPPSPLPERSVPVSDTPAEPVTEAAPEATPAADEAAPADTALSEDAAGDGPADISSDAPETATEDESSVADFSREPPLPPLTNLPQADTQPAVDVIPEQQRRSFADDIRGRLGEGLRFLGERGQLNLVVIATGDSAIWAADIIRARQRDNDNSRGIALVMIDAREHPANNLRLNQVLEEIDVPVLDLVTADNRIPDWEVRERAGAMARKHIKGYRQIYLDGAQHDSPLIVRRIRGWLRSNAAGTELP